MNATQFAPLPLGVAVLFATAAAAGAVGVTVISRPATSAAAAPGSGQQVIRKIVLKTGMTGGKMAYLDEQGSADPVLRGKVGDILEITLASGEGAEHDLVIPALNVHSRRFDGSSGPVKLTFKLAQAGRFAYYCSIARRRQIGMEGVLEVTGPGDASAAKPATRRAEAAREGG